MINVKIKHTDGEEVEYLVELIEVSDATGDGSMRVLPMEDGSLRIDTAPL